MVNHPSFFPIQTKYKGFIVILKMGQYTSAVMSLAYGGTAIRQDSFHVVN